MSDKVWIRGMVVKIEKEGIYIGKILKEELGERIW